MALAFGRAGGLEAAAPTAPPASNVFLSLFLIGDAGDPRPTGEPVLTALRKEILRDPARSFVVFLGDNIYPRGLPVPEAADRAEMERRLDTQVDLVKNAGVRGLFIPGNHDWEKEGDGGWDAVRREGARVDARGGPVVAFLPKDGCPGPEILDLDEQVRLVALDTQWWLHSRPKPSDPTSGCAAYSESGVIEALGHALSSAGDRQIVVVGHHPLASGGPHGGHFSFREHVFPLTEVNRGLWIPLPIIGSIYPLVRQGGKAPQDIANERNRHMREALESALRQRPPLVYAAGHEHTLQVLEGRIARNLLVSGAGFYGHTSSVARIAGTRFASSSPGFMRLDFASAGTRLAVLAVDVRGSLTEVYAEWLSSP